MNAGIQSVAAQRLALSKAAAAELAGAATAALEELKGLEPTNAPPPDLVVVAVPAGSHGAARDRIRAALAD